MKEETAFKKQKINHFASRGTIPGAASGRYIQKKLVGSEKANMRNQMQIQESERAHLDLELEERKGANNPFYWYA